MADNQPYGAAGPRIPEEADPSRLPALTGSPRPQREAYQPCDDLITFGRTSIGLCPENCENIEPPYCHCLSCAKTGVVLDGRGVCDNCRAADVAEELVPRVR